MRRLVWFKPQVWFPLDGGCE